MEIRFVLRLNQSDKTKSATIYCRIILNGHRAGDFSTFEHVLPQDWHSKGQVVVSGTTESQLTNQALQNIRNGLKEIYNQLSPPITAARIKASYLQKDQPSRTFLELLQQLIERKQILKRAKGTIRANWYKYANLEQFLKEKAQERLLAGEFSEKVADQLEFWLRGNLPTCGTEHVAKHLQLVKEALQLAVKLGDIPRSPLEYLALKREKPKKPIFLTLDQLRRLENFSFASLILQKTADLFVFCCYTGLSYEDLTSFSPDLHIRKGPDGEAWLYKHREKTDEQAILPFFAGAQRVLQKYRGKLPFIRNDHYNTYIKQAAAIVGLEIKITTHTARKTAANIWHNEGGLSLDDVALMLGHADPKTTRTYYVQTDSRKLLEAAGRLRKLLC